MSEAAVYDRTASRWARDEPSSLSDFTGRPAVFELCGDVRGLTVLDLGCGEGYCTRSLRRAGAARVVGVDASAEMLKLAREAEQRQPLGIDYRLVDVVTLNEPRRYDLITAVFLFNYLSLDAMDEVLERVMEHLEPGGRFVFSVPHPAFQFLHNGAAPFYFERTNGGYFAARNRRHAGKIHRIDGTQLEVAAIHKTFEDYFSALRKAGFAAMPIVRELGVGPEHVAFRPEFFGPVVDVPLHAAFAVDKGEM